VTATDAFTAARRRGLAASAAAAAEPR